MGQCILYCWMCYSRSHTRAPSLTKTQALKTGILTPTKPHLCSTRSSSLLNSLLDTAEPHGRRQSSPPLAMAMHHLIPLLSTVLVAALAHTTYSLSSPPPPLSESELYVAGVVEYTPNITLNPLHIPTTEEAVQYMMYNLLSYEHYMEAGREEGVQIMVFPEDGLYGYFFLTRDQLFPFLEEIPDPHTQPGIPCGDASFSDRPILSRLSCLAQKYEMALVVNMGDKQKCENSSTDDDCPPNGWYQYNTNVAFDSDGSLIGRYHKTHVYSAEKEIFDVPHPTPHITFNTSFGVTFGTFTCYDILFCDPPLELLNMGIRNFIFPTYWGNSYPFYTSVGFQQGWSWRTGSNFLAANLHFPNKESFVVDIGLYATGSGVYSRGSVAASYISGENFSPATGQLLMAAIPKDPSLSSVPPITRPESQRGSEGQGRRVDAWNSATGDQEPTDGKQTLLATPAEVTNIDMKSNTYLNFAPLMDAPQGKVTVSYKNTDPQLSVDCTLDYFLEQDAFNETYALGAYIGDSEDDPELLFAVCSLVKCDSAELDTCGKPVEGYAAETVFKRVELSGRFPAGSVAFPVVLLDQLELASPLDVELGEQSLVMEGMGKPLLSANLWTRVQPGSKDGISWLYQCPNDAHF